MPVVKNKYLLSITFFLLWIIFFDRNNMIGRYRLVKEVDRLQKDKSYYQEKITQDSIRIRELKSDDQSLEKFAREQYLMKKDNEEIFIIVDD